jgi:tRNA pseudouridine synthase 10
MSRLDQILEKMVNLIASRFEFKSFLLGATIPTQIYEREDEIRAKFKVHTRESIKKELVKELTKSFSKVTNKTINYVSPDIRINITIDAEGNSDISANASPIIFMGTYVKRQRGFRQKELSIYDKASGNGCIERDKLVVPDVDSVEALIISEVLPITGGENPKFSWIGGEDRNSLVLGKGRPFFLRISNPKVRSLKRNFKFEKAGITTRIIKKVKEIPRSPIQFITTTQITVESEDDISKTSLYKLNVFNNSVVEFNTRSKMLARKIYSIDAKQISDKKFNLFLVAEGGLPIKQFVGGKKYIHPNVSEILGIRCECILFDVLDVRIE